MGKRDKQKQRQERRNRGRGSFSYLQEDQDIDDTPRISPSGEEASDDSNEEQEEDDAADDEATINHENQSQDMPSKFLLYQQSVQVCVPNLKRLYLCQWAYAWFSWLLGWMMKCTRFKLVSFCAKFMGYSVMCCVD